MHWVPTGQTVNKGYNVEVLREFRKRLLVKRPILLQSGQWHFQQDNAPVHNFILVTDYLTKIGIKTVDPPPYNPDIASCDFCLLPKLKEKLRGCHYVTSKEAIAKVIDTHTQEDLHEAFQRFLERYKCIAGKGDYFEGDFNIMCVRSIKVPTRKKSGVLLCVPCILVVFGSHSRNGHINLCSTLVLCRSILAELLLCLTIRFDVFIFSIYIYIYIYILTFLLHLC